MEEIVQTPDIIKLRDLPLGLYEKSISPHLSWEDKYKTIRDAGYDYLELCIDSTPEKLARLDNRSEQLQIRRVSESLDVPLYTMAFTANRAYPLGSEDGSIRAEGIRLLKQALDYAAFLGVQTINIAAYDEYARPRNLTTEGNFLESLKRCVDHAAVRGVIIALETMDTDFIDSTKKALQYVNAIDSAYLQLYPDPGNIHAMGHNPVTDIPAGGKRIVQIGLKDTRLGCVRDIFFGEGTLDFDAVFKMLHEIGYRGFFVAEMWWHEGAEIQPCIARAREFLIEKMADY